jgi:hypothetical protein
VPDLQLEEVDPGEVGDRKILSFSRLPQLRPFSTGTGPLNALCARCSFVLLAGAKPVDLRAPHLLIRCPSCGALNALNGS